MAFPFILRFDQVLPVCLHPILQNTFLEILLLITGGRGGGEEIMSDICSEGPSEKHRRTVKSFQPVLHEMEYIL